MCNHIPLDTKPENGSCSGAYVLPSKTSPSDLIPRIRQPSKQVCASGFKPNQPQSTRKSVTTVSAHAKIDKSVNNARP